MLSRLLESIGGNLFGEGIETMGEFKGEFKKCVRIARENGYTMFQAENCDIVDNYLNCENCPFPLWDKREEEQ